MPHDIRNKSFQRVLRGYAPDEVDEYIAYLQDEYRKLERRTADSERKLALALKKLDESIRNGAVDTVGPAAREAASKLLKEAETEAARKVEEANARAEAEAAVLLEEAGAKAEAVLADAMQRAEAILAEAEAEAEAHRDDVKKAQKTAQTIFDEIGTFRERLYALYNEHLDALEGVTDAAQDFMDGVNEQAGDVTDAEETEDTEESPAEAEEETEETEQIPEIPEDGESADEEEYDEESYEEESEFVAEEAADAEEETEVPEEESAEETEVWDGTESAEEPAADEVANNLAFMDRLFASLQSELDAEPAGEDLYIDIPEEEEADFEDYPEENFDEGVSGEESEEEFPSIMIDWKNRSAVSSDESAETAEKDMPVPDESMDFRSADIYEDFEEETGDFEEEPEAENYDDYRPGDISADEETPEGEPEEDEDEEIDEYHDMDEIFNADKSARDMSLTDEFNIIFDDSKSSQNVKEISRQPIVAPENPKNAKKHKKN